MQQHAPDGADPLSTDDDDFVIAQESEFEEPYSPPDDAEREFDDGAIDEIVGLDDERRVDVAEEVPAEDE
ncbi:hypothetical protein WDJ51_01125 [Rathayibacter sp. YIM 133350]|uniref:hypothetical protein n=1 Tax=Rathayibacter sp. YIM 133350 TaxID=3131992 RepID=UPI00307CFD75